MADDTKTLGAGNRDDEINDKPMPLLEHLVELRRRLLWSAVAFMLCFAVCYYFSKEIYSFLAQPLADILMQKSGQNRRMIYTQLYEAFFTNLKVAFFGRRSSRSRSWRRRSTCSWPRGCIGGEKKALLPFLLATPVLFVAGAALAYYFVFRPLGGSS